MFKICHRSKRFTLRKIRREWNKIFKILFRSTAKFRWDIERTVGVATSRIDDTKWIHRKMWIYYNLRTDCNRPHEIIIIIRIPAMLRLLITSHWNWIECAVAQICHPLSCVAVSPLACPFIIVPILYWNRIPMGKVKWKKNEIKGNQALAPIYLAVAEACMPSIDNST